MVVGGGTVKFHFEISFTGFTLLGTTFIRHKPTPVIRPPFKKAKDSREYFLKLINLKKTFLPPFMDGVQLFQDYRSTTIR